MQKRPEIIRIGAVNYLNSRPLIEGLDELASHAELILDYPSRLADGLSSGRYDVALVPSIACLLEPEIEVVSDACVAARGPVLSVKLFSRVPPHEIGRLALDAGSRTSAALVQILLAERFAVRPQIEPLPLELTTSGTDADAVLLIGDRAIRAPEERFAFTWDLGEEWSVWTGLPFVFALWAARAGCELGDVEEALGAARDRGIRHVAAIAQRESARLGLAEQLALDYLTKNLHFTLGAEERAGLALFHRLAVRHELAPRGINLVFRNYAAA
jgi:chorismate dehydratase